MNVHFQSRILLVLRRTPLFIIGTMVMRDVPPPSSSEKPSWLGGDRNAGVHAPEWPTIGLILLSYATWMTATAYAGHGAAAAVLTIGAIALSTALHSSLSHEVAHGHPLPSKRWSEALVFPAIGLAIPYER
ncbi:MAG: hypothetical protein AAF565_13680, partial [Pseudomonadota bacterium]